ncbi:MAG: aminopeptidase [Deltaproteobacteria bacterium]|nr:aminopeptidase [Deltaproteobacteria bacterium]
MRRALLSLLALGLLMLPGCDYGHLAAGQLKILWRRTPITKAVADPTLAENERVLLTLVESVRGFARALGLRVGDQYTSFVPWPGDRIVTTLVRTRPGSLDAVGWWYPFLGRLPYRGYFDQARAEREAKRLHEEQGYDVCVSAVTAYSTLGWLDDPVTSPMLGRGAANLVETLLHELVHATVFIEGDADFNEGVALFIGQEAAIRYFAQASPIAPPNPNPTGVGGATGTNDAESAASNAPTAPFALPSSERVRGWVADRRRVEAVVLAFRDRLPQLAGRPDAPVQREAAERVLRGELASLPLEILEPGAVAAEARLSDACLALRGTYSRDLPRHAQLLDRFDGDLPALIRHLVAWRAREAPPETFFAGPLDPGSAAAR